MGITAGCEPCAGSEVGSVVGSGAARCTLREEGGNFPPNEATERTRRARVVVDTCLTRRRVRVAGVRVRSL